MLSWGGSTASANFFPFLYFGGTGAASRWKARPRHLPDPIAGDALWRRVRVCEMTIA
jgi:hypothetical protein